MGGLFFHHSTTVCSLQSSQMLFFSHKLTCRTEFRAPAITMNNRSRLNAFTALQSFYIGKLDFNEIIGSENEISVCITLVQKISARNATETWFIFMHAYWLLATILNLSFDIFKNNNFSAKFYCIINSFCKISAGLKPKANNRWN